MWTLTLTFQVDDSVVFHPLPKSRNVNELFPFEQKQVKGEFVKKLAIHLIGLKETKWFLVSLLGSKRRKVPEFLNVPADT